MGKAKTWSCDEAEAAARAYVSATHDSVKGSGQKAEDFAKKIHDAFVALAPPGVEGTSTYGERDPDGAECKVWQYVRGLLRRRRHGRITGYKERSRKMTFYFAIWDNDPVTINCRCTTP
jgi:hypothetical protein